MFCEGLPSHCQGESVHLTIFSVLNIMPLAMHYCNSITVVNLTNFNLNLKCGVRSESRRHEGLKSQCVTLFRNFFSQVSNKDPRTLVSKVDKPAHYWLSSYIWCIDTFMDTLHLGFEVPCQNFDREFERLQVNSTGFQSCITPTLLSLMFTGSSAGDYYCIAAVESPWFLLTIEGSACLARFVVCLFRMSVEKEHNLVIVCS